MQELKVLVVAGVVAVLVGFVVSTRRRARLANARIDDPAAATRLARAIVEDIALYNEGIFASDDDAATRDEIIAEGRALFQQRVPAPLHHIYDDAIAEALRR